jgi:hypothetical protein
VSQYNRVVIPFVVQPPRKTKTHDLDDFVMVDLDHFRTKPPRFPSGEMKNSIEMEFFACRGTSEVNRHWHVAPVVRRDAAEEVK